MFIVLLEISIKEALIKSAYTDLRQKFHQGRQKIVEILTDFKIFCRNPGGDLWCEDACGDFISGSLTLCSIVIPRPAPAEERQRTHPAQQLGGGDGQPDSIHPDQGGQKGQHSGQKAQAPQKGEDCGGPPVVQGGEEAGGKDVEPCKEEGGGETTVPASR